MAFQLEGAGFFYQFDSTFDLIDYNREVSIPSRPIHREHGQQIDKRSVRREMTTHVLQGYIQRATVTDTATERDAMEQAINAMPDEAYLVDTVLNRRVSVKLVRSVIPRQPRATLFCSLFFRTSDNPYWEDKSQTVAKFTAQGFSDLSMGNVESWGDMVLTGRTTHPTLVQGNWNFCAHMETVNATAINTKADKATWDTIAGVFTVRTAYSGTSKFGTSIGLFGNNEQNNGGRVRMPSMLAQVNQDLNPLEMQDAQSADRINLDAFTVTGWVNTKWDWNDGKLHYFMWSNVGAQTRLNIFKSTKNNLVLQFNSALVSADVSGNRANSWYFIGAKGNALATISPSRYAELSVNSTVIDFESTAPGTVGVAYRDIFIGTDNDGNNPGDALFDDWCIWKMALASNAIKSTLYNSGTGRRASTVQPDSILTYLQFDGTAGSPIITGIGTQSVVNFAPQGRKWMIATSINNSGQCQVGTGATKMFLDNDRIKVYDERGEEVFGFVDGNPTDAQVTVEATLGGGVAPVTIEKLGVSAGFNGTGHYAASISSVALQVGTQSLEVGVWVNRHGIPPTNEVIVGKSNGLTAIGWNAYFSPAGSAILRLEDASDEIKIMTAATSELDGRWHHIWFHANRVTPSASEIRIDGANKATTLSGTMPTLTVNSDASLMFGAVIETAPTLFLQGKIALARLKIGGAVSTPGQVRFQSHEPLDFSAGNDKGWTNNGVRQYWEFSDNATPMVSAGLNPRVTVALQTSGQWEQTAYISRNLWGDHEFEQGGFGKYQISNAVNTLQRVISTRSGQQAMLGRHRTASDRDVSRRVDFNTNEDLVWRAWYRFKNASGQVRFTVFGQNQLLDTGNAGQDWRFFENCFQAVGLSGPQPFQFRLNNTDAEVDAMEIVSNLVDNSGCEAWSSLNTINAWTETESGDSVIKRSSDNHTRSFAALASIDSGNATAMIGQAVSISSGYWYEIGAWANADTTQNNPEINLMERISQATGFKTHNFVLSTLYQRFTVFTKAKHAGTATIQLLNGSNAQSRQILIDDVSCVRLVGADVAVTAVTLNDSKLQPARHGFGRDLSGDTFTFSSLVARSNKMAVQIDFRAQSAWSTLAGSVPDKTFLDLVDGASALGTHHLELFISDGRWIFGHSGSTLGAQATAYVEDKDITIAFKVDTSLSTGKAKLIENGIEIASTATFTALSVNTLTDMWIGTNRNQGQPINQVVDEVYMWHQDVGVGFLKGTGGAQKALSPTNKVWSWQSTVATADYLEVDHHNEETKRFDTSVPARLEARSALSGEYFQLGEGNAFSHSKKDTIYTPQAITHTWKYRKTYY